MSLWFAVLEAASQPTSLAGFVQSNTGLIITAVAFIITAVVIIAFLKQILINSVLGVIAWALLQYVFQVKLGFWVSLIVSIIFGLAGIGVLLVLKVLGVSV